MIRRTRADNQSYLIETDWLGTTEEQRKAVFDLSACYLIGKVE
jgi:hypothetical protein